MRSLIRTSSYWSALLSFLLSGNPFSFFAEPIRLPLRGETLPILPGARDSRYMDYWWCHSMRYTFSCTVRSLIFFPRLEWDCRVPGIRSWPICSTLRKFWSREGFVYFHNFPWDTLYLYLIKNFSIPFSWLLLFINLIWVSI